MVIIGEKEICLNPRNVLTAKRHAGHRSVLLVNFDDFEQKRLGKGKFTINLFNRIRTFTF